MNWIKQNTFLAGFIAVMVIGVGVLGFLLVSSKGTYETAQEDYDAKVKELNRLETAKPYPENENLKLIEAQKKEHIDAIVGLQKSLVLNQFPVEPMTPEAFQDKLREAVNRVVAKANEKGVKLFDETKKFYLGFDRYQTEPPEKMAAPLLGQELKGIELAMTQMIEAGVVQILKLDRDALPEEDPKAKKPASPTAGAAAGKRELAVARPFSVDFIAEQSRFKAVLNSLITNKAQFFVPRMVMVKNDKPAPPPKAVAVPGQPVAQTPGGAVAEPPPAEGGTYVFGTEKVEVSMLLEMIDFAEIAAK